MVLVGNRQIEYRIEIPDTDTNVYGHCDRSNITDQWGKDGLNNQWPWDQIKLDPNPISDTKINYRFIQDQVRRAKLCNFHNSICIGPSLNDFKSNCFAQLKEGMPCT